ncbi:hypothetical protein ACS0TY_030405 [Phlomoides rotata]
MADRRRRNVPDIDDPATRQRDLRDIKMDDLWRQVQQRLERYEPLECDESHHNSKNSEDCKGVDYFLGHEPYEGERIYDESEGEEDEILSSFHGKLSLKDEIHYGIFCHQNIMAKGSLRDSLYMINKQQEIDLVVGKTEVRGRAFDPGILQRKCGEMDYSLSLLKKVLRQVEIINKRPGFDHHKKAGAMNALVRVSTVLTNAPYILNLDCDHYINNSKAIKGGNIRDHPGMILILLDQSDGLLVEASHVAYYQRTFRGFQDTLYAKSGIQFYKECDIYGTVDFIFGHAAAVFQSYNIYAQKPLPTETITFTIHN